MRLPDGTSRGKDDVMSYRFAATRTLPHKPILDQLRKQAEELLDSYRAGKDAAVAEVKSFAWRPDPADFALADAQRVLARAYGFSSWPSLENHVEGVDFAALLAAAEAGDVAAVRLLSAARLDPLNPCLAEFCDSALHRGVLSRNEELTRVLMQLGANARVGIFPHYDTTSAYAIAVDREYSEIVATIEHEEDNRRERLSHDKMPSSAAVDALRQAIAVGRAADAIALMEADPALIGACDMYGVTPLHLAASKHAPAMVGWLLDHGASPGTLALRDTPVRRYGGAGLQVESGKTPLDFAAIVAGWAPEGRDSIFYGSTGFRVESRFRGSVGSGVGIEVCRTGRIPADAWPLSSIYLVGGPCQVGQLGQRDASL